MRENFPSFVHFKLGYAEEAFGSSVGSAAKNKAWRTLAMDVVIKWVADGLDDTTGKGEQVCRVGFLARLCFQNIS
tara:strand:+ start:233 stop:457 length:225 start_codon:yes stop_codon:yes gene_type:complete